MRRSIRRKTRRSQGQIRRIVAGRLDQSPHLLVEVLVRKFEREIREIARFTHVGSMPHILRQVNEADPRDGRLRIPVAGPLDARVRLRRSGDVTTVHPTERER